MKNSTGSANGQYETCDALKDSMLSINKEHPEKKAYTSPTLKRYTSPKLRKHKSYKDITMLFAVIPPIPPTSP